MTDSHKLNSTQYRDYPFGELRSNRLQPWCIIRHLPKLQRVVIARFRARQDAEAYLHVLRSLTPSFSYSILFDIVSDALPEPSRVRRSLR